MLLPQTTAAVMLLVSFSASAQGAAPQATDVQAAATKLCNAKLDHDNFPYSTMEECVDDQSAKLLRAQKTSSGAPESEAGRKPSNPG